MTFRLISCALSLALQPESRKMNALFEAAKEVADFMKARRWKFCVIGGLAVQRWGEPRLTRCRPDFADRVRT
jgi:hypothetical protein